MADQDGRIYYSLGIDNTQLKSDANQAMGQIRNIGDTVESEGDRMDGAFRRIGTAVAAMFTISQATKFIKKLSEIGAENQRLEATFVSLTGSQEKAANLLQEIEEMNIESVLPREAIEGATQRMLSFGIEAENIIPNLKRLQDVSLGDASAFESLAFAFSRSASQGKLISRDYTRMVRTGFNPLLEIADKTGESMKELEQRMKDGGIGINELEGALKRATSAGGRFADANKKQMAGIDGSVKRLKESIRDIYVDISEGNEGVIAGAIDGASELVAHYKEIGEALAVVVGTYGTYKAALIATQAVQNARQSIQYTEEANQLIKLIDTEKAAELQKIKLKEGNEAYTAAVQAETKARVTSAQANLTAAREEVAASAQALSAKRAEYIAAKQNVKVKTQELALAKQNGTAREVEIAQRNLNAATTRKEAAAVAFQNAAREKSAKTVAVETAAKTANTERTAVNTATQVASTRATNIFTAAQTKLTLVWKRLNAVIMNNPLMIAAAAITLVTYGIYKLATADDAATRAQKKVNDEMEKSKKTVDELRGKIDSLTDTIKDQTASLYERVAAFRELQKETPDLYKDMSFEEFSNLSPEERKERENKFFDQKGIDDINKAIEKQEAIVNKNKELLKDASFDNVAQKSVANENIKQAEEEINLLKEKQKEQRDNLKTAKDIEESQKEAPSLSEAQKLALEQYNDAKKLVDKITENASDYTKEQFSDAVEAAKKAKKEAEEVGISFDEGQSTEKERQDYTQQIKSEKEERTRAIRDLELSVSQSRIDAMNDGAEKIIEQNKLNHERELEDIRRQREDMLKQLQDEERAVWESQNPEAAKNGATFTPSTTELPDEIKAKFDALINDADQKLKANNKKVLDDLAKEYGTYQQKRATLAEKWEKKIAEIPEKYKEGARQKMNDELADLDDRYGKTASAIENLFNRARNQSRNALREIVSEAKKLEQALKDNEFDESFGLTKEQFERLRNSPQEMDRLGQAIDRTTQKAKRADNTIVKLGRSFKKLWKSKPGSNEAMENLEEFQEALGKTLGMSREITGSLTEMFDALGNESMGDTIESIGEIVNGVGQTGMGVAQLASGDLLGGVTNTISGIAKTIGSIARIGDKSKERAIQRLQAEFDTIDVRIKHMEWNISDLQNKMEGEFGKNKSRLIGEQSMALSKENRKLKEQNRIINQQIKKEEDKKKTDNNRIEEWRNQLDENNRQMELNRQEIQKNKKLQVDALFGEDIQTAIENFSSAFADAWAGGKAQVSDMKSLVKDMMRSYVLEMIKADPILKETLDKLRENINISMQPYISDEGQEHFKDLRKDLIEDMTDSLNEKYGDVMDIFEEDTERQGTSKGIESISQDSADELNGRFAALQAYTFEISDNIKVMVANSSEVLDTLMGIETNTSYNQRLDGMDKDLNSVKKVLQEISQRGVIIRN